MSLPSVRLAARLSRAEAVERLAARWPRRWRTGDLIEAREVLIPYLLFRVTVANRGEERVSWLALDAVTGGLDPYELDAPLDPAAQAPSVDASQAVVPATVPADQLRARLVERVRRRVYLGGFFRLSDLRIEAEGPVQEVRVPYWVGIYRRRSRVTVEVIGAVRRQPEGGKVRDVILRWLATEPALLTDPR